MRRLFAHSRWDALLVAAAVAHGAGLASLPAWPGVPAAAALGIALWWNSNTVSHNFIHRPFFGSKRLNVLFSWSLTLLMGYPQTLWRDRHLMHHAGLHRPRRLTRAVAFEAAGVLLLWAAIAALEWRFFLLIYLPGWLFGMGLCALQGHFEHSGGRLEGISTYGAVYNFLFFRDGYHVEHHRSPSTHWTRLRRLDLQSSRWCPVLRWMEHAISLSLAMLEGLVFRWGALQDFVLSRHERAFKALLPQNFPIRRVAVVGGGMFPRTALILQKLIPECRITIIDRSARSIRSARAFVEAEFIQESYGPSTGNFDLVVAPLSYVGDKSALYRDDSAPLLLVHDWIWRRTPESRVISILLLKRLNLVRGAA